MALTNASKTVTDKYTYDAWGKVTHDTGSTQQPYLFVGQLGYYSHYQEPILNPFSTEAQKYVMLQLGVRYYVPEMGRFTQQDPEPVDEEASYVYGGSSPVFFVDPDGAWRWPWSKKKPKPKPKPKPPTYWIKRAIKCAVNCAGTPGDDKAFAACVLKCMGKGFLDSVCVDVYCYIKPNADECNWKSDKKRNPSGNACHDSTVKTVPKVAQDCCNIKYTCCTWLHPQSAAGCQAAQTQCYDRCPTD